MIAIFSDATGAMLARIQEAVVEANQTVALQLRAAFGEQQEAPPVDYYMAVAHQHLFCQLCEADYETLSGGNTAIAEAIIANCKGLASHWENAERQTP
ncbi:hypothetical protein ACHMW7_19200 [Aminobacter sp. UC22_36]|uniref:hypothetical protein n=1 Tax=Aminobacter sp. UC22_36 TaxID=3374549 RepID=UPI0037569E5F